MKKTTLEYDEALFDEARKELGTKGLKATVDAAFREVIRERATRDLIHRLQTGEGFDPPWVFDPKEAQRKKTIGKNPWFQPLDT